MTRHPLELRANRPGAKTPPETSHGEAIPTLTDLRTPQPAETLPSHLPRRARVAEITSQHDNPEDHHMGNTL